MRIGFIGCGSIAQAHIEVLKTMKCKVISVCGRYNSDRAKIFAKQHNIKNVYSSWKNLVKAKNYDVLWVMPSWDQIENMLIPLCRIRVPIFFEKPVALRSSIIRQAIHEANSSIPIMVGYNRRFYSFVPEIKSVLCNEKLLSAEIHIPENIDKSIKTKGWNRLRNLIFINGSHIIDLARYILGDLRVVNMHYSKLKYGIKFAFNGLLENPFRIPVHLISNWSTPGNYKLVLNCDHMKIVWEPLEKIYLYEGIVEKQSHSSPWLREFKPILKKVWMLKGYDLNFKPGFYKQAQFFLKHVRDLSPISLPGCTLYDCWKTTQLCENILGVSKTHT